MDQNVKVFDPLCEFREFCTSAEGYVKWKATYMVMDDLEVKVLSTSSFFTLLKEFDVEGIGAIEEKVVDLGMDEVCHSSLDFCMCIKIITKCLFFCQLFINFGGLLHLQPTSHTELLTT
jgi:hypothetical protein